MNGCSCRKARQNPAYKRSAASEAEMLRFSASEQTSLNERSDYQRSEGEQSESDARFRFRAGTAAFGEAEA